MKTYEIRAGRSKPCELVEVSGDTVTMIDAGTWAYCMAVRQSIEGEAK